MTIEKLPDVVLGFCDNSHPPVLPLRLQVSAAGCASAHAHPRGQLIYASSGVMHITTPAGRWVVPPQQAVWLPPELLHEVQFPGRVTLHSLFIGSDWAQQLPESCEVLAVSPLLHALVERAHQYGTHYPASGPAQRMMQVLVDEIAAAPRTAIHLPSAGDERLCRAMQQLSANPADNPSLTELAVAAHCSARTLARLFVQETGLTFSQWRRRLLLHTALPRLAAGEPVTQVALELGYQSLSAFISMFRRELGLTPGHFLSKPDQ